MSNPINKPAAAPTDTARLLARFDALADLRRDADAANVARISGIPRGPVSGFKGLDRELGGAFAPGIHVLHGTPGAGKTAFALQVAAQCQCPALFVSCEMAPAELLRRHTARETGTFLGRLKSGELTGADAEKLARQAIEAAPFLAFADATQAPASFSFLLDAAQIVKSDAERFFLVLDSLHSWAEGAASGATEYEALNAALLALRRLSAALACPVLVVSERNRESMSGGGQHAGAGTRKIEYSAETVIDLKRSAEKSDGAGEVAISLTLQKNRHGATGKPLDFRFNGALQRFRECNE
jgi:replicative DNA helicase